MSIKVFQDKIFPRHVSDLMNLMHMVVFKGSDGEEQWQTWLTLREKEYIALGLAQYYQCEHCIDHHLAALCKLEKLSEASLCENVNSMILFLRIDTRTIGESEKQQWIHSWQRFSYKVSIESRDKMLPSLIGVAIGIARNDEFLINFCGAELVQHLKENTLDIKASIGELESVVIFMKAAVSKNRVVDKVQKLID